VSYFGHLQRSMCWEIEVLLPEKLSLLKHNVGCCMTTHGVLSSSETLGSLIPSPHSGQTGNHHDSETHHPDLPIPYGRTSEISTIVLYI
jgi:hypothetical protein